jgi:hypothetical protein
MRAIAFYPTRAAARPTTIGIFTLPLAEEAPAVAGHQRCYCSPTATAAPRWPCATWYWRWPSAASWW